MKVGVSVTFFSTLHARKLFAGIAVTVLGKETDRMLMQSRKANAARVVTSYVVSPFAIVSGMSKFPHKLV